MASDQFVLIPNARHQPRPPDMPYPAPTPASTHEGTGYTSIQANMQWLPPPRIPTAVRTAFSTGESEDSSAHEQEEDSGESSTTSSSQSTDHWEQLKVSNHDRAEDAYPRAASLAPSGQKTTWIAPTASNRQGSPSLADERVNTPFVPPPINNRVTPILTYVKIERYTPTPSPSRQLSKTNTAFSRADTPVNQPWSVDSQAMPPPPIPKNAAKRKSNELDKDGFELIPAEDHSNGQKTNGRQQSYTPVVIKREQSTLLESKPDFPIAILPLPLPSKRFKKSRTSLAVLIPVEQLPVFALPPLPTIDNPDLLKQVFSHQSLFRRVRGRFEEPIEQPVRHYEKLEHVGDSILGMIVTTWLHETRPRLTCGSATKLKAHLVSNATLSHLSGLYNLPQRLNGDPDLLPVLRASTDIRAALMEAYIAALYLSFPPHLRIIQALPVLDGWLREMYEPLYDFFYNYMKTEHDQHHATIGAGPDGHVVLLDEAKLAKLDQAALGMAALVRMYGTKQEREMKFEEERYTTHQGLVYKMTCLVDGIELGVGTRSNRKTASNVAGWEAAKKLGLTASAVTYGKE